MREMSVSLSVGEISELLRSDADAIARALLPGGSYVLGEREWRCTGSNSPTGSTICVFVAPGPKQGVCGFWNDEPKGGDLIDLYRRTTNCSEFEAVQWAKEWLGLDRAPATRRSMIERRRREIQKRTVSREDERAKSAAKRRKSAANIWNAAGAFGAEGATYLSKRGINPSYAGTELRVHPNLRHPTGGVFPAIVGRVSNASGEGVGVWRIYLKPTGEGKAPVDTPKLGLGDCLGSAVKIGGVWTEIGVAEGIETAVACRQLIHKWNGVGMPVWAALSSAGMSGLIVPPEVQSVRIFADNDAIKYRNDKAVPSPGMAAANALATRLRAQGIKVRIEVPPVGKDWLDVLNSVQNDKAKTNAPIAA